ncbi:hypothetical protein INT47_011711 [Mucor saturninus]|uniref:Myb-like domain-containing protein n=1 Tax=Mucor saturninus TaxID=64648 RepID=A0A8H7V315_9FUNG|nr:hypothetical protein INT47_011711 [Mucor saturninus]
MSTGKKKQEEVVVEEEPKSRFFPEKVVRHYTQENKQPGGTKNSNTLRTTEIVKECNQKEKDTAEELAQSLLEESKKIDIVKKDNFFNEEVTVEEREIIAQRVALQQRQFAAYERRENIRKSAKIRKMFDYVCDEEILECLKDCNGDEDEVIYRLTKPAYLCDIRKAISLKYAKEEESYAPLMTSEQRTAYEQLLKKRSVTLKKTTNDQAKKQYRMCGRLGLDEALEQFQNNQIDPEKAFEGWSQARIKAYQMIDQNPNSYYYRFNAPGEVQRKGQWDEPEKKMFFDRLADVGANGQWGLFSMTIPGRVGYQCSNFYRLLVETQTINDPNYVLDERGKAHYLFDKKSADGQIKKTFRTHSKHASNSDPADESGPSTASPRRIKKEPKEVKPELLIDAQEEKPTATSTASATNTPTITTGKGKGRRQPVKAGTRKRRSRFADSDSNEDSNLFDDDFSGNYSTRAARDEEDENGQRKSKRARRPTAAAIESGLATSGSWHNETEETDPMCPLPGFVDPITLEQVIKPAISKYGHVMGYDSWTRCLTNWEGKRNICPLTKKALTKRDLVILTFDNLDEYKDKIVNM